MKEQTYYKNAGLALATALVMTACGGGGSDANATQAPTDTIGSEGTGTTPADTVATETTPMGTVGSCSITEGTPKSDTRITVRVRCAGSTDAEISSATVTVNGTSKNVDYTSANFTDFLGFDGLKAETSYEAVFTVVANGETLSISTNIKTKKTPITTSAGITHNGTTYGTVTSPHTGKVWLDRNLGAARVCTSFNDDACYGDYYQWGRNADGHEDSLSSTTTTRANDVNSAGSSFIIGSRDWASVDGTGTTRTANWSKTDGSSVCPAGYRVPTLTELEAETLAKDVTNGATAFANFLKLPSAGYRYYSEGEMVNQGSDGFVWTSSVEEDNSLIISFGAKSRSNDFSRATAVSVRCIKN